jgi:membrane protein
MKLRLLGRLLIDAAWQWSDDNAPRMGAALAYYTIFSIAPLLVIATAVAGLIFGHQAVEGQISEQIRYVVGAEGGEIIQTMVASAGNRKSGILATVIGSVVLLFGALGLFSELQAAMNTIWKSPAKPMGGIFGFLKSRLPSFLMMLGSVLLIFVSVVFSAILAGTEALPGGPGVASLAQGAHALATFIIVTLLFAMIYRLVPNVRISWGDVGLGAVITALLFTVGKWLIGLYLGRASVASAYGAAGSLAVLLIWVYYSAQIFLFGAEFTRAYAQRQGHGAQGT